MTATPLIGFPQLSVLIFWSTLNVMRSGITAPIASQWLAGRLLTLSLVVDVPLSLTSVLSQAYAIFSCQKTEMISHAAIQPFARAGLGLLCSTLLRLVEFCYGLSTLFSKSKTTFLSPAPCCGLVSDTANKSARSWQQVVVMEVEKRHDTRDTTGFCPGQLITDLLRRNWCNGFWPLLI